MQQVSELSDSALEQLALQTLGHDLLEFARESVIAYLEDNDGVTRKDAALCCCKLVVNSFSITQFSPSRSSRAGGRHRCLIEEGQHPLFPRILGHEAGGIVESVGEGVTELKPGDKVLPIFTGECDECRHCKSEDCNMCDLFRINTDRGVMSSEDVLLQRALHLHCY